MINAILQLAAAVNNLAESIKEYTCRFGGGGGGPSFKVGSTFTGVATTKVVVGLGGQGCRGGGGGGGTSVKTPNE